MGKVGRDRLSSNRPGARRPATASAIELRLPYRPPYDWTHLQRFLAARAIPGIESGEDGHYARTVATPGGWATVRVQPIDGDDAIQLHASGADAAVLPLLAAIAQRVFDLGADPATIARAFAADPLLAPLVAQRPGLRLPGVWDPFECALRAIVGQQVAFAAGITLIRRVVERAGQRIAIPVPGLTHLFPSAADILAVDLSGLGLTGARIGAIKSLAQAMVDRTLDFGAPAEDVVARLLRISGIGPWTAQYVALRALGERDAFLPSDLVIRRMASAAGEAITAAALNKRSNLWRPWRAYAAIHLWAKGQTLLSSAGRPSGTVQHTCRQAKVGS